MDTDKYTSFSFKRIDNKNNNNENRRKSDAGSFFHRDA